MPPADFGGLLAKAKGISGPAAPELEETPELEGEGHDERARGAVEDLMGALKGGDVDAATDAFKAAVRACRDYDDDEV